MKWMFAGVLLCFAISASGCAGARVDEQLANPSTLRQSNEAIAIFRIPRPDPGCLTVGVQLGVREGPLFRPVQTIKLSEPAVTSVAGALLAPGEYHIVSFSCTRARSTLVLMEPQGNGLLRRSYATFTLAAGEVVNLGQIQLVAIGRTPGLHVSFINVALQVTDWPLAELERFKSQRPRLFGEMRARLMTTISSPATPDAIDQKCAEFARLVKEGKVQDVPPECVTHVAPSGWIKRGQKA